jgi:hypothetical protein
MGRLHSMGYLVVGSPPMEEPEMSKVKRQSFEGLSPEERAVVGSPEDYAWNEALDLPARPRLSDSVQFSIRIDRSDMSALQKIAASRETSFSETVRDALRRYVAAGGAPALTNIQVSIGAFGILRTQGRPAQLQPNRAGPVDLQGPGLGTPALTTSGG